MSKTYHQIPGHPCYALHIAVCQNAETIRDGREIDPIDDDEAVAAVWDAAKTICLDRLGDTPDAESHFPDWHGGKWAKADARGLLCAANVYGCGVDEDGEPDCEWSWCSKPPMDMAALAAEVVDAIDAAADGALREMEARAGQEGD